MAFETIKYAKSLDKPNNLKDLLLFIFTPFAAGWVIFGFWWAFVVMLAVLFGVAGIRIVVGSKDWGRSFQQAKTHMTKQGFQVDFTHSPRLIIDATNRKIALVSPGAGSYDLYDLTDILGCDHTWMNKSAPQITNFAGRATRLIHTKEDNMLVIKTKNPHNPLYQFPIGSYDNGQLWLARLGALINR